MKIRLAIYMTDTEYADRLFGYFVKNFIDGLELSLFSEYDAFSSALQESVIDILLTEDTLEKQIQEAVQNQLLHVAYMTERKEISDESKHYIFKYQQAKLIYKEIEKICAENNISIAFSPRGDNAYIYTFVSSGGGAGATTVALAAAISMAKKRKVLYLNLERYGTTNAYLSGAGNGSFDDVLSALFNKRINLETMLESAVSESEEGVFYFKQIGHPSDMEGMTKENINKLFYTLQKQMDYEYIFVDMERSVDEKLAEVMRFSNQLVVICDGTDVGCEKFTRFYKALEVLEQREQGDILSKTSVFYNKFRSKENIKGSKIAEKQIMDMGVMPFYKDMPAKDIIREMSKQRKIEIFDRG